MQWFIIYFLEMQQGIVRICTERERERFGVVSKRKNVIVSKATCSSFSRSEKWIHGWHSTIVVGEIYNTVAV